MARKNNDDTGITIVLMIIFFGFVAVYFIIKWLFIGLAYLIKWISESIKKNKVKKEKEKIYSDNLVTKQETYRKTSNVKKIEPVKITPEEIKKKINIFDTSIYNNKFYPQIKARGEIYYNENRIKNITSSNNVWNCKVDGTEEYDVSITFDSTDINKILEATCTCPFYKKDNQYCKHIYSLLYKLKCTENNEKIHKEFENNIIEINTMIKNVDDYILRNQSHYSKRIIEKFNQYKEQCMNNIENIKNGFKEAKIEETKLRYLIILLETLNAVKQDLKAFIDSENSSDEYNNYEIVEEDDDDDFDDDFDDELDDDDFDIDNNKTKMSDVITGIALGSILFNHKNKDNTPENISEFSEKELDDYGLEEWQKEEVRKGNYYPWSFEEDGDLEEDDYYYDDDP